MEGKELIGTLKTYLLHRNINNIRFSTNCTHFLAKY